MKHLSVVAVTTVVAVLLFALPASAGRAWCRADPIVTIGGTPVQIWVAIPAEWEPYVDEKIQVEIKAPQHLERKTIFLDEGFNGHGEEVKWGDINDPNPNDADVPLEIEVRLEFDKNRMEDDFGKDELEQALGDDFLVPIQVTVNIGEDVETFDTHIEYGNHKQTRFMIAIEAGSEVND